MKFQALTAAVVTVMCLNLCLLALSNLGVRPQIGHIEIVSVAGEPIARTDFLFWAWLPIVDLAVGTLVFFGTRRLLRH